MAVINPPGYLHNLTTHTAVVDRLSSSAGILVPDAVGSLRPRGGLRMLGDYNVTAPGGMNVAVAAGVAYVPQGQSSLGGAYVVPNDGSVTIAIPAAHATLPRRDLVVVRVQDSFYAGAVNTADIILIQGTAASTPSDPSLPTGASYVVVARVAVAAAASAITSGNITMIGQPAPVVGAAQPVLSTDATAGVFLGQERDHPTRGPERWDGTGWRPIISRIIKRPNYTPISTSIPSGAFRQSGVSDGPVMAGFTAYVTGVLAITATFRCGPVTTGTGAALPGLYVDGVQLYSGVTRTADSNVTISAAVDITTLGAHTLSVRVDAFGADATWTHTYLHAILGAAE